MLFGSVSWVKRGTYLENARLLEKHVDFVELLVYTWNAEMEAMLAAELDGLRKLDLFYTVHMPTDTMENCRRAYEFFREKDFPIRNHTLHPLEGWENFIEGKADVTLENLIDNYPLHPRMTVDIGHLQLAGTAEGILGGEKLREIVELHVHGVWRKKDHVQLTPGRCGFLRELHERFGAFRKAIADDALLVNFEIFSFKALLSSLSVFRDLKDGF